MELGKNIDEMVYCMVFFHTGNKLGNVPHSDILNVIGIQSYDMVFRIVKDLRK